MIALGNQNQFSSSFAPLGDLLKSLMFLSNLNGLNSFSSPSDQGFAKRKVISLRISGLDNLASVRLPTVVESLQRRKQSKRRPEMTDQTPSDEKVSMEFQMFWRFLFKRFLTLFGSDRSFI